MIGRGRAGSALPNPEAPFRGCGKVACAPHKYVLEPGYSGGGRRGVVGQAAFVASCIPRVGGRQVTALEDYPGPSARHSATPFICLAAALAFRKPRLEKLARTAPAGIPGHG
jgi:hypothetical protein